MNKINIENPKKVVKKYEIGDIFKWEDDDDKSIYICMLTQVAYGKYAMIYLASGNRMSGDVEDSIEKILKLRHYEFLGRNAEITIKFNN